MQKGGLRRFLFGAGFITTVMLQPMGQSFASELPMDHAKIARMRSGLAEAINGFFARTSVRIIEGQEEKRTVFPARGRELPGPRNEVHIERFVRVEAPTEIGATRAICLIYGIATDAPKIVTRADLADASFAISGNYVYSLCFAPNGDYFKIAGDANYPLESARRILQQAEWSLPASEWLHQELAGYIGVYFRRLLELDEATKRAEGPEADLVAYAAWVAALQPKTLGFLR